MQGALTQHTPHAHALCNMLQRAWHLDTLPCAHCHLHSSCTRAACSTHTQISTQAWLVAELVRQHDHALAQEYCRTWGMDAAAYQVQPAMIAAQEERDASHYLQLPATTAWVRKCAVVVCSAPQQRAHDLRLQSMIESDSGCQWARSLLQSAETVALDIEWQPGHNDQLSILQVPPRSSPLVLCLSHHAGMWRPHVVMHAAGDPRICVHLRSAAAGQRARAAALREDGAEIQHCAGHGPCQGCGSAVHSFGHTCALNTPLAGFGVRRSLCSHRVAIHGDMEQLCMQGAI